jgi:ABC-2 type transport system permease protein
MKKILNIALKDLRVNFRDPAALIMMLVTPLAITLAIGFAFGGFNRSSSGGLGDIPVTIVNYDPGDFGEALVDTFESEDLAGLLEPVTSEDEAGARLLVDQDKSAAVVIIPSNFSESILPQALLSGQAAELTTREQAVVEIYANPGRSVSVGIIQSIVERFSNQVQAGSVSGQVTIAQMLASGRLTPDMAVSQAEGIGMQAGMAAADRSPITVEVQIGEATSGGFDWLAYTAPSMAIVFLMFTVSSGGRSILAERGWGTLSRLLVSPSRPFQIIAGKSLGIFLTGLLQMAIVITAGWLMFRIHWGDGLAVVALIVLLAVAATGWGMLLAATARSAGEAGAAGNAVTLLFAAAAGSFIPRMNLPGWLQNISLVTPNAWGLDGFMKLANGGTLVDVAPQLIGLAIMAAILFAVSTLIFRRQYK